MPFRSVDRLAQVCSAAKLLLVKEIRLVGQLSLLASTLQKGGIRGLTIVHLVRDPRPMLASQIKLHWWGLQQGSRKMARELEALARRTCNGMESDAAAGAALHGQGDLTYLPVRFEDLVASARLRRSPGSPALGSLQRPLTAGPLLCAVNRSFRLRLPMPRSTLCQIRRMSPPY